MKKKKKKNGMHIFVWQATPVIQCARRFFSSIPQGNEKKKKKKKKKKSTINS